MDRREFLHLAASTTALVLSAPPRETAAAAAKSTSTGYGYATNAFVRLKGDGSIATFDEVVNVTTSVSPLAFDGVPAVKCSTAGAITAEIGVSRFNTFMQPVDWNGGLACAVYFEDISKVVSLTLYLGNADYSVVYFKIWSGQALISGWNMLAVTAREFNVGGGTLSPDMIRTKLRVNTTNATAFHVAYFSHYQRARNKVLLTFDDGYAEHYGYLKEQLVSRKLPAAFAIDTGVIGRPGYMTQAQVQEMHDHPSGLFTIANHGLNNEAVTMVGVDKYMSNLLTNRARLNSWGCGNGKSLHIYVQGMFNDALVKALRGNGIVSAREVGASDRTAKTATRVELDSMTMMLPASVNLEDTEPLNTVRTYLANAIRDGGTFVVMGHRFHPSSNGPIQWTESDMNALLDEIAAARNRGDLDVIAWPEWHRGLGK